MLINFTTFPLYNRVPPKDDPGYQTFENKMYVFFVSLLFILVCNLKQLVKSIAVWIIFTWISHRIFNASTDSGRPYKTGSNRFSSPKPMAVFFSKFGFFQIEFFQ